MSGLPSATLLHPSYKHETILEQCGFTDVTISQTLSPSADASIADSFCPGETPKYKRWLYWVDRRRGLLGRVSIAFPNSTEPVLVRNSPSRDIINKRSASLPSAALIASLTSSTPDPPHSCRVKTKSLSTPQTRGVDIVRVGAVDWADSNNLRTRSCSDFGGSQRRQDFERSGDLRNTTSPRDGCKFRRLDGIDRRYRDDGTVRVALLRREQHTAEERNSKSKIESTNKNNTQTADECLVPAKTGEGQTELTVEILLKGLNDPTRIAAITGESDDDNIISSGSIKLGVYFIHSNSDKLPRLPFTTAVKHEVEDTCMVSSHPCKASHYPEGKLSFLAWGAHEATTVVECLCNPIAICVGCNIGVLLLEEVPQKEDRLNDLEDDPERERTRRMGRRQQRRYRVCHLNHSAVSSLLDKRKGLAERFAVQENPGDKLQPKEYNTTCDEIHNRPSCNDRNMGDTDSETDWKISSACATNVIGHSVIGNSNDYYAQTKSDSVKTAANWSRRESNKSVDPREVLVLPPSSDGELLEQPVDMCVLPDETLVIAFTRWVPLHDGAGVSEAQGVVRAFPAVTITCQHDKEVTNCSSAFSSKPARSTRPGFQSAFPAKNDDGMTAFKSTRSTGDRRCCEYTTAFNTEEYWVVAERLPVITRIVTGGRRGDAVYASFCGSTRDDGVVTAVASIPLRRDVHPSAISQVILPNTQREICTPQRARDTPPSRGNPCGLVGYREENKKRRGQNNRSFVAIVSGHAASLAADENNNLFYVTAENKGVCKALRCRPSGGSGRRRSSLHEIAPIIRLRGGETDANAINLATRAVSSSTSNPNDFCSNVEHQMQHAEATAARKPLVSPAQAAALSDALTEEDHMSARGGGSRPGKQPLFFAAASNARPPGAALWAPWQTETKRGALNYDNLKDATVSVNITVVARCRPLLARERKRGVRAVVFCKGDTVFVPGEELPMKRSRTFGFDRVFGSNSSQARVYAETVAPVVDKMLDGFNCSVLAYGQTGSGKTFTMEGGLTTETLNIDSSVLPTTPFEDAARTIQVEDLGIITRAVHTIFRKADAGGNRKYWVYVSHMEIYNEKLYDLLAPETSKTPDASNTRPAQNSRRRNTPVSPWSRGGARSQPPSPRRSRSPSPRSALRSPPIEQQSFSPRPRPSSPTGRHTGAHSGIETANAVITGVEKGRRADAVTDRRVGGNEGDRSPRVFSPGHAGSEDQCDRDDNDRKTDPGKRQDKRRPRPLTARSPKNRWSSKGFTVEEGSDICGSRKTAGGTKLKGMGRGLSIEESSELGVIVKGLTQVEVKSAEEIFAIVARSKSNRRTAETMCNVESSRSHGVFCVRVISAEPTPWGGEVTRDGRLSLVDLSGSESIKRSGAVGARAKEAAAIGQSLLALGRVIKALVRQAPHVPYRESKLTRVLGDSLGGNAFTAIILNITPNHSMIDETLSTLTYAKTAQRVGNTPKQSIATRKDRRPIVGETRTITSDEANSTTSLREKRDSGPEQKGKGDLSKRQAQSAAAPRLSASAGAPTYVRPWEGRVPINAPSTWGTQNPALFRDCISPVLHSDSMKLGIGETESDPIAFGKFPRHHQENGVVSGAIGAIIGHQRRPESAGVKGSSPGDFAGARRPSMAGRNQPSIRPVTGSANQENGKFIDSSVAGRGATAMKKSASGDRCDASARRGGVSRRLSFSASEQSPAGQGCSRPDKRQSLLQSFSQNGNGTGVSRRRTQEYEHGLEGTNIFAGVAGDEAGSDRVFDSAAATWAHTVVLEPRCKIGETQSEIDSWSQQHRIGCIDISEKLKGKPAGQATATTAESRGIKASAVPGQAELAPAIHSSGGLRPAARDALVEIFFRYNRDGRGRRFLLSDEVATMLHIWYVSVAEPPPPIKPSANSRRTGRATPASIRPKNESRNGVNAAGTKRSATNQPRPKLGSVSGGNGNHPYIATDPENGGSSKREVLSLEAFLEFCRQAAARDAIFMRHLFLTCGYDVHLNLSHHPPTGSPPQPIPDRGDDRQSGRYLDCGAALNAVSRKNEFRHQRLNQTKRTSFHHRAPATRERHGSRIGNAAGVGLTGGAHDAVAPQRQQPHDQFKLTADEDFTLGVGDACSRRTATGGVVDPSELWDIMEVMQNNGHCHGAEGLLSRGGGAHISGPVPESGFSSSHRIPSHQDRSSLALIPEGMAEIAWTQPAVKNAHFRVSEATRVFGPNAVLDTPQACIISPKAGVEPFPQESLLNGRNKGNDIVRETVDIDESDLSRAIVGVKSAKCCIIEVSSGVDIPPLLEAASGNEGVCEWCGAGKTLPGGSTHSRAFCDE